MVRTGPHVVEPESETQSRVNGNAAHTQLACSIDAASELAQHCGYRTAVHVRTVERTRVGAQDLAENQSRTVLGRECEHLVVEVRAGQVDSASPSAQRCPDDVVVVAFDRGSDSVMNKLLDDGNESIDLFGCRDTRGNGTAQLCTKVDEVCALCCLGSGFAHRRFSAVRYRLAIGRILGQVDHAHDDRFPIRVENPVSQGHRGDRMRQVGVVVAGQLSKSLQRDHCFSET